MNARTERQITEMKEQTIGVEVEMNNIKRSKAAKVAADFFGTGRYENTAGRNGYYTWSAWDGEGREWKFQRDVSIHGADDEKCELVTPILTYADIETLQELIRILRRAGAKSDYTRGCGVHYAKFGITRKFYQKHTANALVQHSTYKKTNYNIPCLISTNFREDYSYGRKVS